MLQGMESIQLSSFYRNLKKWPESVLEFSVFLESFSKLLSAPFLALYLSDSAMKELDPPTRVIFQITDPSLRYGSTPASPILTDVPGLPVVIEAFLKKQLFQREPLKSVQSSGSLFKQIQISGDFLNGFHLGVVAIGEHGWLIAAFPKIFSEREEFSILVAAQRLISLADVHSLESQIQLRSQFLSIASHELKTPLTSIYGMLQLQERMWRLKKDDPSLHDPERQRDFLKRMIRQVERLNELIDGLLDISRIQNGRFMVEPSESNVAEILNETISTRLENVAKEAGVKLHLDVPESFVAWIDPVRMEELVTNLIMNAIRFSPEGGVVWIKLTSDQDSFKLSIRDQGPTVPREDRDRIFQPFERAQRTARLGGLGLGLFISRQIAQLHGGSVNLIESVPGKGNVFEAHFPTRNSAAASA
jgi:signal transduction histidine kinase